MDAAPSAAGPPRLRRGIGRRSLLFLSIGAIIGSGWLFSALDAAKPSGGSSVVAWLISGALVITLALVHAELGTMFPVDGGSARFPLYAFGRVTGFVSGWFAWVAAACIAPIETEAALRYAGNYLPWLIHSSGNDIVLSPPGVAVAAAVLACFTLLNVVGLKEFAETNTIVVWWKIALPVFVAVIVMSAHFNLHNFVADGSFFSGGANGVLSAISTGGVVFALIGFEQAVELGGETENPQRNIPWAIIGSVVVGLALYLLLQVAFVGSMPAKYLQHGWSEVHFQGIFGPFAGLALALGASFAAYLIYVAAIISPAGTGLTYTTTASRLPFALSKEGYLPRAFSRLSTRDVPVVALGVSYVAEVLIVLAFPNWDALLRFVTAAVVLVYAMAPLALGVLRREAPDLPRPYRIPLPWLTPRAAFWVSNLIIIWSGWRNNRILFAIVAAGMVVFLVMATTRPRFRHHREEWTASMWLVPYVGGMVALSYASPYGSGAAVLPDWAVLVAAAVFSEVIYRAAVALGAAAHNRLPAGEQPVDRWHHTVALLEEAAE